MRGLSTEVQQKLNLHKPETIGQAARISGITPAAISLLLVHLKRGFARARRIARAATRAALRVIAAIDLDAGLAATRGSGRRAAARTRATSSIAYLALLAKWNRTYNLTAIREPERMVTHHVLDALAVLPHLPRRATRLRVLDVGSGGGVPGHSARDRAAATGASSLLDSNHKKGAFLQQAAIELALPNVEVVDGARRGLRAGGAVRRRDLARLLRSRDVRANRARGISRRDGRAGRDEGRVSGRGNRAAAARRARGRRARARGAGPRCASAT